MSVDYSATECIIQLGRMLRTIREQTPAVWYLATHTHERGLSHLAQPLKQQDKSASLRLRNVGLDSFPRPARAGAHNEACVHTRGSSIREMRWRHRAQYLVNKTA